MAINNLNQDAGYRPGEWKAYCDICGLGYYASELKEDFRGLKVCPKDYETRNPQDFVRSKPERITPPWSRPTDGAGFTNNITVYTSDPALAASLDRLNWYVDTTTGNVTWTLPDPNSAAYFGEQVVYTIANYAGSHNITVGVSAGITLIGSSTIGSGVSGIFQVTNPKTWRRTL